MYFFGKDGRKYWIVVSQSASRHAAIKDGSESEIIEHIPIKAEISWLGFGKKRCPGHIGFDVGTIFIEEQWIWEGEPNVAGASDVAVLNCFCPHQHDECPETGPSVCGCIHGELNEEHRRNGIASFVLKQFEMAGFIPCPDEKTTLPDEGGWREFWAARDEKYKHLLCWA